MKLSQGINKFDFFSVSSEDLVFISGVVDFLVFRLFVLVLFIHRTSLGYLNLMNIVFKQMNKKSLVVSYVVFFFVCFF